MPKVGLETETCNPIVEALARSMIHTVIAISRHPEAIAATRKIFGIGEVPVEVRNTGALSKTELGTELGVSTSTIDRMDREGAPHIYCGDAKRYDLSLFRVWLAQRGKKATKATPSSADNIDITDIALTGGLRASK